MICNRKELKFIHLMQKCKVAIYGCTFLGGNPPMWHMVYRLASGKMESAGAVNSCMCFGNTFYTEEIQQACAFCEDKGGGGTSTKSIICYN